MPDPLPLTFPPGDAIDPGAVPTRALGPFASDDEAHQAMPQIAAELVKHQTFLMAHEAYGVLVLFQGMDGSGKDEAIRDALAALDPRGTAYRQFKRPQGEEKRHDYLWRVHAAVPKRGEVGIFNRSHYEQVVGERLHPEALDEQGLPAEAREGDVWARRHRQINDFERYLAENGVVVLKFFMHVSKDVQRERLLERTDRPEEKWQFSASDVKERQRWDEYTSVYGDVLTATNTAWAPWLVVPADWPWVARAVVGRAIADRLRALHEDFPLVTEEQERELAEARRALEAEVAP